jgi:GNAT superfamily N-acetyltransferase
MIIFATVDPQESREAYQWHRGFAGSNDSLFPRSRPAFEDIVVKGYAWSARNDAGDYLALAYANFDSVDHAWELGGLMVATNQRGKGLGSILMRLALGNVLFEENPLEQGHTILAHVLKSNPDPRDIITHSLKFVLAKELEIPADALPGLKANAAGIIEGDEFHFVVPDSLTALIDWIEKWGDKLKNGEDVEIVLRPHVSLRHWAAAFRDMSSRI